MYIETTPPNLPPKLRRSGMMSTSDRQTTGTNAAIQTHTCRSYGACAYFQSPQTINMALLTELFRVGGFKPSIAVAQTFQSAVSQVFNLRPIAMDRCARVAPRPPRRFASVRPESGCAWNIRALRRLKIGDTAGRKTCATKRDAE